MKVQGHEESKHGLLQTVQRQEGKPEARGVTAPRRDPTELVSCRLGDSSCAGAHASALGRGGGRSYRGSDSLLQLQRRYGNQFVQRVLGQKQAEDDQEMPGAQRQEADEDQEAEPPL
jgi:hypothetical protein